MIMAAETKRIGPATDRSAQGEISTPHGKKCSSPGTIMLATAVESDETWLRAHVPRFGPARFRCERSEITR